MKKLNKILSIFMLVIVVCAFATPVFAGNITPNPAGFNGSTAGSNAFGNLFKNAWSAIQTIANFVALVMVVVAGIRYMFASADAKADIKKQTVILIVGAVFIFAAGNIVNLIATAAQTVTQ